MTPGCARSELWNEFELIKTNPASSGVNNTEFSPLGYGPARDPGVPQVVLSWHIVYFLMVSQSLSFALGMS